MNEQYKQELPAWLQIELEKEEIMKNTKNTHYVDFSNPNADRITSTSTTSIKQETIEEAAERLYPISGPNSMWNSLQQDGFIEGAKWQEEKMFTKNDIIKAFYTDRRVWKNRFQDWVDVDFEEWFEKEFKKK